jgi:ABC-2 type transport system ATP-binding protein
VHQLSRSYEGVEVVHGVTLEVGRGEVYGLLGRNGAGKTTIVECILGLRAPSAGSVRVGGLDREERPAEAKRRLGAQLQDAALPEKITVREALAYFRAFHRDAVPVGELMAQFELGAFAGSRFETLSAGQKQRLFLALAFLHRPEAVLLDEPSTGLDPQARRELHRFIRQVAAQGVAVLLTTHDLAEAEELCHRVGILHGGRLVRSGAPAGLVAEARRRPRLRIVGSAPLPADELAAAAKASVVKAETREVVVEVEHIERAAAAVASHLAERGIGLVELGVKRPTLEDVFFEATGKHWEAAP